MRRIMNNARYGWIAGGSVLVLSGCDPTVRGTVLGGVEGAATVLTTSFVQAFFESLVAEDEGDPTIVKAMDPSDVIFT